MSLFDHTQCVLDSRFELRLRAERLVAIGEFALVRPLARVQVHVLDELRLADDLDAAGLAHDLGLFLLGLLPLVVGNL